MELDELVHVVARVAELVDDDADAAAGAGAGAGRSRGGGADRPARRRPRGEARVVPAKALPRARRHGDRRAVDDRAGGVLQRVGLRAVDRRRTTRVVRVHVDDVRPERDAPERLESRPVGVPSDHDVPARRDGRPRRQRVGHGRVRLDELPAADVERGGDGRRRHRSVRGPRRPVAAGVRRAGAEVVLRRGRKARHRERVRGDEGRVGDDRAVGGGRPVLEAAVRRLVRSPGHRERRRPGRRGQRAAHEDRRETVVGPVGREFRSVARARLPLVVERLDGVGIGRAGNAGRVAARRRGRGEGAGTAAGRDRHAVPEDLEPAIAAGVAVVVPG